LEKLDLAFALGALALAGVVAGVLYALYPEWFSGYTESSDGTSIASSPYISTDGMTSTPIDNSTATQNTTSTADSASAPQPSNNSGY
jgi:hypothetical protein